MLNTVTTTDRVTAQRTAAPPVRIPEDWLAVVLGATVLALILFGAAPALPGLRWSDGASAARLFAPEVLGGWVAAGVGVGILAAVGLALEGGDVGRFTRGYPIVFALAWLSLALAGHTAPAAWGIEYVIFALALGLLVSHAGGVSPSIRAAARSELFIKTGLVIMGATILFADVLQAGALGIVQAIGVVIVVWYAAFWLAKRFRVDEELAVMLSTAVSICGVSAAIAACGAIQGDRRKLSYVTALVLVVAVPMIVLMPWIVRLLGIPDVVAGAWMGGTLDTTPSVVAAGALVSDTTMKIGTIVKFSQNVLIGVAALILSIWWAMRHGGRRDRAPGASVIWQRFPKFVLGFLAASLVFSFLLGPELVARTKDAVGSVRTIWFALAFVSIGLETRLGNLVSLDEGRPLGAFLLAQAFNVAWTLLLAWLIFGGMLFRSPVL
ncbi:MAG: putative sulfate exporter family transporter [Acidobacteria bacterium]|nr:putative sulfate exporter family transporter [Acidobacteriota bacterium]